MRNRNLLIILFTVLLIALVAVLAVVFTAQPKLLPEESTLTAPAYVYITAGGEARWFELPTEETMLELKRTEEDGEEMINVISLSPEGVYVQSASCENQDCVEQGLVTLENREERILRNLIVCLPNEVAIELYSPQEVQEMLDAASSGEAPE